MKKTRCLTALAIATVLLHADAVLACPTCKEGFAENGAAGAGLARGFELSIYLMLAAPLLILSTLAIVFVLQIRRAKLAGQYPSLAEVIAQAEAMHSTN